MSDRVKIAVIDDHPIFRDGVIRVLIGEPAFVVVGEGRTAEDAVRIAEAMAPDVMLLDINMPGCGLKAARIITARAPIIKILILTVSEDDDLVVSALKNGAKGYALKGISGPELVSTIWTMQAGESHIGPELAARILTREGVYNSGLLALEAGRLTALDHRILALVIEGHSNAQIAQCLAMEVRAVGADVSRILRLFQAGSLSSERNSIRGKKRQLH